MNKNRHFRQITIAILAFWFVISCNLLASPASTETPEATATQPTEPAPTETVEPTLTAEVGQETSAASPGASCTVLQDLNLRFGPGTAYRPPIRALPGNSVVTPLGFAPQGIPGGTWAYVQEPATQGKGWVSAGSQYISCNVELATLPSIAFGTPPPPPLPKSAQTSNPDGNGFCVDSDSEYVCIGTLSDESLFQFQIIRNGIEQGENDGVEPVSFTVSKISSDDPSNKVVVYEKIENNVPYCIFGGNGSCSSWVFEDGIHKWTQGGTPVEPGEYEMEVNATVNGQSSRWAVNFTLTLP
jgi:hypothetical protein